MSFRFTPPERHVDIVAAMRSALSVAASAFDANPFSTISELGNLLEDLQGNETDTPENLAWLWLSQTITEASAEYVGVLRRQFELTSNKDRAIAKFIEAAIPEEVNAVFDDTALRAPSMHPAFAPAKDALLPLILDISRLNKFDDETNQKERLLREFDHCLHRASAHVFSSNYTKLKPLIDAVTGPASEPLRRDAAWARHNDWIHRQFTSTPVFSPDGSVTTPLEPLYLDLRCYWHETIERDEDEEDGKVAAKPKWKAHLGDLHTTVDAWLHSDEQHKLRLVAGGPGSGKSSFAKAFASKTASKASHRVLFFELQHMNLSNDLEQDINRYLARRNNSTGNKGSAGMPQGAFNWVREDERPVLLVFDGLDEITYHDDQAKEVAKRFILSVARLLNQLNTDGTIIKAVVLGRNMAIQEGMKEAVLPLNLLLNVAPIRQLETDDLHYNSKHRGLGSVFETELPNFDELDPELICDQRPKYWDKWTASQSQPTSDPPEAVIHKGLSDLNVEPLLLHLLILSDFCGDRWPEAAENQNRVYEDILCKIHARNKDKESGRWLPDEADFFLFMEALGISAWRGNGRAGDEATFNKVRDVHCSHRLRRLPETASTDLRNVVLQTHARQIEGPEPGFEFIHKSFGEYLSARGMVSAAERASRRLNNEEEPVGEVVLLQDWTKLIHDAVLTVEVLRFLHDESRLRQEKRDLRDTKGALETLLNWVQVDGFPVHLIGEGGTYRDLENRQRCAEASLLATASAVACAQPIAQDGEDAEPSHLLSVKWVENDPRSVLNRLQIPSNRNRRSLVFNRAKLRRANLSKADLAAVNLFEADLSRAELENADLSDAFLARARLEEAHLYRAKALRAVLYKANLRGAILTRADLSEADLRGADLRGADLRGADLKGAYLKEADLSEADLREADLSTADLSGADLSRADLSRAVLNSTKLTSCVMTNAMVRFVDLRSVDFDPELVKTIYGVRSGYGLTKLPESVPYPDDWHRAEEADNESQDLLDEYRAGFRNRLNILSRPPSVVIGVTSPEFLTHTSSHHIGL